MTKSPRVSVIICSIDEERSRFLRQAVVSVSNQTLNPESYEVVVVRSYLSEIKSDDVACKVDCDMIIDKSELGKWIRMASEITRGDVLVFMDDDDMFHYDKLRRVLEIFDKDDSRIYYHNSQLIFKTGELNELESQKQESVIKLLKDEEKIRDLWNLWKSGASFNLSSISIRRSLLNGIEKYLEEINTGVPQLLFFNAICSNGIIVVDGAQLTFYRIHNRNLSTNIFDSTLSCMRKMARLSTTMLKDISVLNEFLRDCKYNFDTKPLLVIESKYRLYNLIITGELNKKEMVGFYLSQLRSKTFTLFDPKLFLLLIYLFFPHLLRRILSRSGSGIDLDGQ